MRGNQPTNHVHGMWRNLIGGDVWLIKYFEYLQLGNWNAYCFHSIIVDVSGTKTGLVVYGWARGPTDPGTDWADVASSPSCSQQPSAHSVGLTCTVHQKRNNLTNLLLSYYLANKRSLHVCSQSLEIPRLIEEK